MQIMKNLFLSITLLFTSAVTFAQQEMGKITLDVQAFTSEVKLKKKIETTLKSGGLDWGVKDGQMIFTMVNKRFINFDMPNFTRYGTPTTIDVPAGEYHVTCVGFIPKTAFSPEKALAKGAYFNENIMQFSVSPNQTTTVKIRPVIQKNNTLFLKFFQPELLTSIELNGTTSDEVSITKQNDNSVLWPAYNGNLKFKVE